MKSTQIDIPDIARLAGHEPLWRYMPLSRLLSMINGSAFIPKLATLQRIDRNESKVTAQCFADSAAVRSSLAHDQPNREWFLKNAHPWERTRLEKARPNGHYEAMDHQRAFQDIWLRELALRRCVWCWFEGRHESMAQWNVYSREGVAIRSDVNSVLKALADSGALAGCAYGRIHYIDRTEQRNLNDNLHLAWHPYFAKQGSFKHEHEVRFVFRDDQTEEDGRLINITFSELVKEIVISPYLPDEEATAVMLKLRELLPREIKIDVNVSAEQSDDAFRRTDQTFGERFRETFQLPYEDVELPPALVTDMPATEMENLAANSL